MKMTRNRIGLLVFGALLMACDPTATSNQTPGSVTPPDGNGRAIVSPCGGSKGACIGVKYVVYKNSSGKAVATQAMAEANIQTSNRIWKSCGVAFQLESFTEIDPRDYGLTYGGSASAGETYEIRQALQENDSFLVVTTGAWGTTKNAWTESPNGSGKYGVVMEASVAGNGNILAHELGHYLGLDHIGVTANVMSSIIYSTSTAVNQSQCATVSGYALNYWERMLR